MRSPINFKDTVFVLLIFLILTAILTFPLLLNFTKSFPGFYSTDEPFGALWDLWRVKYSVMNNLSSHYTYLVAAPFGFDVVGSGTVYYLHWFFRESLLKFTSVVFTYNFQIILNFVLLGLFTYLLTLHISKSKPSAIFSGVICGFCPYQFVRSWQHLSLTFNEWIPLCLLTIILLREKFSRKNILLFILSILLLFSFDYSIMYSSVISLFVFLGYNLFFNWKNKILKKDRYLLRADFIFFKKIFILGCIIFIILLPQLMPVFKNILNPPSKNTFVSRTYTKKFEDLFVQSARPLSYLLPATVHPIFGEFTEQFIGTQLYGESLTEHTLYLGWVPLVLAFVAVLKWKKNRRQKIEDGEQRIEDFYIGFFILLAVVAWFFSQPPWWQIGPLKIYMPSFFMYKILPMFRAYCRFGIVVMLAVAVLAGFGLKYILERFKTNSTIATNAIVTVLFCGLVLFEFWNWPPYKVIDVSKVPAVYYWLKEQPGDFAIAEYPSDADSSSDLYKFYQITHNKKIINGTIPGTYANRVAQAIVKASDPHTASLLKWMGVKYIIVHREDYQKTEQFEILEELQNIPKNPGLKFVKTYAAEVCSQKNIMCIQETGPIDVYEVVAMPIEPKVN